MTIDPRRKDSQVGGLERCARHRGYPSERVIVQGSPESMELLEALVHELDEAPAISGQIKVFRIVNGDATALVQMLPRCCRRRSERPPQYRSCPPDGESPRSSRCGLPSRRGRTASSPPDRPASWRSSRRCCCGWMKKKPGSGGRSFIASRIRRPTRSRRRSTSSYAAGGRFSSWPRDKSIRSSRSRARWWPSPSRSATR